MKPGIGLGVRYREGAGKMEQLIGLGIDTDQGN